MGRLRSFKARASKASAVMLAQSTLTSVPNPKNHVSENRPGMVANSTKRMTLAVLIGPWACGELTFKNPIVSFVLVIQV